MRAADLLAEGVAALRAAGLDGAAGDARVLLAHALGVPRDRLTLAMADPAPDSAIACFRRAIAVRAERVPVAQITGQRAFWGHSFIVTADVLDPRPETETLIEAALEQRFDTVLDLGTGSGAIVLSLLAERAQARAVAVDLSQAALDVAARNADALGVAQRVIFQHSDWFAAIEGRFDLIVSNPPYIGTPELAALAPDVRVHEPRMALVPAGDDGSGLAAYRVICAQAVRHLTPGGWLMAEIGHRQGDAVQALFHASGLVNVGLRHDLSGHPRVVLGQRKL
ncbi:Release factor glutamine methyltransferase [Roseibaca ekhonensis]|jgi:release factor glutamine methyltransferase|uniref:Release factor glutamine methyltransferase n=1 Tax=Roseinatronobacter ekhonensis TaxID=254356 RepID=A0A3B0MFZ9_9RHOB|nr:peptide chain release factor N(5)-glutamine methyltransferase [Roseibaca ekhonensis]SUZ32498.1 Release factor glutamine methyltransferase [Roseibaca ekhonensis]